MVHDAVAATELCAHRALLVDAGGVRRTAAVSFYQLLQLKTWDVIQVEQHKPYGDVLISRTVRVELLLLENEGCLRTYLCSILPYARLRYVLLSGYSQITCRRMLSRGVRVCILFSVLSRQVVCLPELHVLLFLPLLVRSPTSLKR